MIHGSHTFSLTIESSGGATGSGNVRNPEYPLLLEEALRRLGSLDVELIDAFVDSRRVAQLSTVGHSTVYRAIERQRIAAKADLADVSTRR